MSGKLASSSQPWSVSLLPERSRCIVHSEALSSSMVSLATPLLVITLFDRFRCKVCKKHALGKGARVFMIPWSQRAL